MPGSGLVKAQAEREGLDRIFADAGFEWRFAGCSMCLATNGDHVAPGERCASTSNRNFVGTPGTRVAHAPHEPGDGRCRCGDRPPDRRAHDDCLMEPFLHLDAVALPIARPNVDTDQIVPARYLQKPRSDNFGDYLFRDVREDSAFVFNREAYRGARIVVAERNFGCGSSREHAVWALYDHGFRAAIAPSFGDIFASNAQKNGFLPIVLPAATVAKVLADLTAQPGARLVVDLPAQVVRASDGTEHAFEIDAFAKHCLLEGLDEISYTLTLLPAIEAYESRLSKDIR